MNRKNVYILQYILALLALLGLTFFVWRSFDYSPFSLFVVAVLLLIPGRVNGYFWRDFYRGRRLMSMERWQEAIPHFQQFLKQVEARPTLRQFIWFTSGFYTRQIEAMTHNNLGAARMELGDLRSAKDHFATTLELDSEYAIPHVNLARLALLEGSTEQARESFACAKELGFRGGSFDQLAHSAAEILARIEGRGTR